MSHIDIHNKGEYVFEAVAGDNRCVMDMHKEAGMSPSEAFLGSLGACVGVYLRKYVDNAGLDLPEFSVSVEAELDSQGLRSYKKIDIDIDLKGLDIDEKRVEALLAFARNCPVHNTTKCDPEIQIRRKG